MRTWLHVCAYSKFVHMCLCLYAHIYVSGCHNYADLCKHVCGQVCLCSRMCAPMVCVSICAYVPVLHMCLQVCICAHMLSMFYCVVCPCTCVLCDCRVTIFLEQVYAYMFSEVCFCTHTSSSTFKDSALPDRLLPRGLAHTLGITVPGGFHHFSVD